jgi:hypothetical protein
MRQIPMRIIQTDKSADLPLLARAATTNLRMLNPEFDYMFFDDLQVERFIDTEFPQFRSAFDSFPERIQRYDFFRYLVVFRYGGFYFDTDVLLADGLKDLLSLGCVFPFEEFTIFDFLNTEYGMDWQIGNYAFGAAAGHPFIEAVIQSCIRAQKDSAWTQAMVNSIPRPFRREYLVLASTGPGLVSRTLAEYPSAADPVSVLFPPDVRDPKSWHCFGAYGVHLQVGTWRKRRSLIPRVLHNFWELKTRKLLLKASTERGAERSVTFKKREHKLASIL